MTESDKDAKRDVYFAPQFSPDGKQIVCVRTRGSRKSNWDIFLLDVTTREVRQLTHTATDSGAGFSPDGQYILFTSARTGSTEIYRMTADGQDQTRLSYTNVSSPGSHGWNPVNTARCYSPDGERIAFRSTQHGPAREDGYEIYVMGSDGSEPTRLTFLSDTNGKCEDPVWHPDGQRITFTCWWEIGTGEKRSYEAHIYFIRTDGSDLRRLDPEERPGGAWLGNFSPEGRYLAISSGPDVLVVDVDTGSLYPATSGKYPGGDHVCGFSPDGSRLLFQSTRQGRIELWLTGVSY